MSRGALGSRSRTRTMPGRAHRSSTTGAGVGRSNGPEGQNRSGGVHAAEGKSCSTSAPGTNREITRHVVNRGVTGHCLRDRQTRRACCRCSTDVRVAGCMAPQVASTPAACDGGRGRPDARGVGGGQRQGWSSSGPRRGQNARNPTDGCRSPDGHNVEKPADGLLAIRAGHGLTSYERDATRPCAASGHRRVLVPGRPSQVVSRLVHR